MQWKWLVYSVFVVSFFQLLMLRYPMIGFLIGPMLVCALAEDKKFSCHLQASIQWYKAEQRLTKGCLLDSDSMHHFNCLPLH